MRAAMIGLGKLGLPCAEVMALCHDIIGFDLTPPTTSLPIAATLEDAVKGRELIFVAVPTPHDPAYGGETPSSHLPPQDFDYTCVAGVLDALDALLVPEQIVVLISTCLPGTVRQLATRLTKARLLYNPYLIAMGTVKEDMGKPEMIIVGTRACCNADPETMDDLLTLHAFYQPIVPSDTRWEIGTWDEAEAIKIFYNALISTKLAVVNMIQDVAERNGHINVDTVTQALAASTQRIISPAYMTAGLGDAGPCHPRDNIALRCLSERLGLAYDLFGSISQAREAQAHSLAQAALRYGNRIVILGKAYKPGVAYTAGSCSLLIGHYIEALGGAVSYYDPTTGDLAHPLCDVYLIAYWDSWTESFVPRPDTTIIDPWRRYPATPDHDVIHYGNPQANTFQRVWA